LKHQSFSTETKQPLIKKEVLGDVDLPMQVKRAMLRTEGKVQTHLGDIKVVLNDAGHDLRNAVKKTV
jgi:hypothetical protein